MLEKEMSMKGRHINISLIARVSLIFIISFFSLLNSHEINQSDNKSTKQKICSSITNILTNEINKINKTKNETKLKILKGGLNYVNDVCSRGEALDLNRITEELSEQDKAKFNQRFLSTLFDGTNPNLKQKDFSNYSKTLPILTEKSDKVADLKSYNPVLKSKSSTSKLETASTLSGVPEIPIPGMAIECCGGHTFCCERIDNSDSYNCDNALKQCCELCGEVKVVGHNHPGLMI